TLRSAIAQVIVGEDAVVEQLLLGVLAGGHCLLEGVPGLGKALLVRSLRQALDLQFRRAQFTPDLMASDVIGTEILEQDNGTGDRHCKLPRGLVFAYVLGGGALERAPPATRAALREAMQVRTGSCAGIAHPLPPPLVVFSAQSPLGRAGSDPLPDEQLDRL